MRRLRIVGTKPGIALCNAAVPMTAAIVWIARYSPMFTSTQGRTLRSPGHLVLGQNRAGSVLLVKDDHRDSLRELTPDLGDLDRERGFALPVVGAVAGDEVFDRPCTASGLSSQWGMIM